MTAIEGQTIRPSKKTALAADILASLIFFAGVFVYFRYFSDEPAWLMAIPLICFIPVIRLHLRWLQISMRLADGHLTVESGLASRTRRTIDVAKIQDVTVSQTLGQRLIGVGDLRFESAGESSRVSILGIDKPREVADAILAASNAANKGLNDLNQRNRNLRSGV